MDTLSLHGQTIKIHASVANLDKVIEDAIKEAINHRDVFVPGQPEYEALVSQIHNLANASGMSLDPSEVPDEFAGAKYGVTFDSDGQLSYESRKHIASFIVKAIASAKIVVSVREDKTIGSGANFTIEELTPKKSNDDIAKCVLRSIGLDRIFKEKNADLTCERVEVKVKGGAMAGFKTE